MACPVKNCRKIWTLENTALTQREESSYVEMNAVLELKEGSATNRCNVWVSFEDVSTITSVPFCSIID